ncbi:glucan 1,3-alpha-glucosidase [Malassezia vespertilionis]|uniref:Glucosidase II subunit alpha n=1 Tax=Malassezia vespertilionis TaxID=2020962 RepID=A0A2N1JHF4_9BASI|nr:glucan 1,3-alpha-glucosidase [Malassezia vespertilionis]PKI85982.1 hypothetical protein MVES_000157 [Malassezia vespertilionis]WFD04835.1 glucan 1,3-alpha-glucosidase [Malassezia vespertilionis]
MAEYVESFAKGFRSPYSISAPGVVEENVLTVPVYSALYPDIEFAMWFTFFQDGTARVQMDQRGETYKGWKRYDQAAMWAITELPAPALDIEHRYDEKKHITTVRWGTMSPKNEMRLQHDPVRIEFVRDGVVQMVMNERALLHMEHFRAKPNPFPTPKEGDASKLAFQRAEALAKRAPKKGAKTIEQWSRFETEDAGEWEETWDQIRDSKPKGPEGVALDISFPGYDTLYGLPEHASPLSLRSTRAAPPGEEEEENRYSDPYRLMNTDVFEYKHDSPMSLYGNAPILHAQSKGSAVSVLWMNAAETWIDLHKTSKRPGTPLRSQTRKPTSASPQDKSLYSGGSAPHSSHAHFFSESGILDLFVFLGPSSAQIMQQFTALVGRTALPQYFAIGYHQCRWNYLSDKDVVQVSEQFDAADMPMDVMWLDIEYSKDHMYGVWDQSTFPDPERMVDALDDRGRKLVLIMDPHLKKTHTYYLYQEAKDNGLLVKTKDGTTDYEGDCWSKRASWIDVFNPASWLWWSDQFSLAKRKLKANARNVFVWNDMSEPAIFDGPEVTSPKDVIHHGGWENRDVHNINGLIYQNLTATGLTDRELGTTDKDGLFGVQRRPFVLSRAWWLGSQRFGAIWTGDNMGTWEHFAVSVPMILSNGLGGMSFCGADIGGFFGNPDEELLLRWYQAGIFEPFFRAHAHIDTKRREPYLYDGTTRDALRRLLQLRYQLLPVWYTAFWKSHMNGQPVLRPQHLMFPLDTQGFAVDDQYYLGDSGLLVKPPVQQGVSSVAMYLAEPETYYHFYTHHLYQGVGRIIVPAPLTHELPLLLRGGSILPVRERNRRAAELQRLDPFTLYIAVSTLHAPVLASGQLYMDDGQTFAYQEQNAFIARQFTLTYKRNSFQLASASVTRAAGDMADGTDVALQHPNNPFAHAMEQVRVERVVILGLPRAPKKIVARDANGTAVHVPFHFTPAERRKPSQDDASDSCASKLVLRDPKLGIAHDWVLDIE